MPVDDDLHLIAEFHIARNGTHHLGGKSSSLCTIEHIVTRYGINSDPCPCMVVDMNSVGSADGDFITHRIVGSHRCRKGEIFILITLVIAECSRINWNLIAQLTPTQVDNLAGKRVTINLNVHRITDLCIAAHRTAHQLFRLIQFKVVQHIIVGHLIDGDFRIRMQVDMHRMIVGHG